MSKGKDLDAYYLQTLSQAVAERETEISDYACNIYADKIAQINLVLDLLSPGDTKNRAPLIELKIFYKKIGTALWFMKSGELSNLGARLGSTVQRHKVRE